MCVSWCSTTCACTSLNWSLSKSGVCSCASLLGDTESCLRVIRALDVFWCCILIPLDYFFFNSTTTFLIVELSVKGDFIEDGWYEQNTLSIYHEPRSPPCAQGDDVVWLMHVMSGVLFSPSFINSVQRNKYINNLLLNTAFCSLNTVRHVYSTPLF